MNDKKLTILGIVAVCMVAWAVTQTRISDKARMASDKPAYLIQGLETRDINSIVIGEGNDVAALKRRGESFVVANKDDYPAEAKQINDLITRCLDIQTSQFITEKAENHEALGLAEKKAGSVIKFFKADGSLLTGLIIGNAKEAGKGNYVRLATNDKVYIASEVPWVSNEPISYIDQKLIAVERDNIESVTVSSPDGQYSLKGKTQGDGAELENIPAGKKLKDSDGKSVFNAATDISFTDVKKRTADTNELTFDRQYICRLKDSTVYTLKIAVKNDKTFVVCQAEFTEKRPTNIEKNESEEELKKKEAKLLADDKAKQFNARNQGWIYEIADWKANNLTKKLSDLLEDEAKPAQAAKGETPQKTEQKQQDQAQGELATGPAAITGAIEVNEPNSVEAKQSGGL